MAETLAGQKPHINYNLIPGVVYTWPEVAGVGKTEEQLKKKAAYKVGSFPMRALGRSRASGNIDSLIKSFGRQKKTDEILGVHMIGAGCRYDCRNHNCNGI